MSSKKKRGIRSACHEGQTMDSNPSSPTTELENPPASAADTVLADPAILQKELAAQKEDYLRLAADFDNFKKRTRRDSEQQAAAQKEAFIDDLLPVVDNLERALACEKSSSFQQLYQ